MDKRSLSERDICTKFITPALRRAGWNEMTQIREEDGIESNFPAHFRTCETADLFLALIIRLLRPGGRTAVVLPDGSVFRPYASIGTNLLSCDKGEPTRDIWYWEQGEVGKGGEDQEAP